MRGGVPCLLCRKRASWRCLSPQRTQSGVGKGNRGDPVGSFFAPQGLTARILLSSPTRRGFLFETWVSPCLHACVLGSQTGGVKAAGVHSRTAEGEGPEMRGIKDRSLSAVLQHGVAQFPVMPQRQAAGQGADGVSKGGSLPESPPLTEENEFPVEKHAALLGGDSELQRSLFTSTNFQAPEPATRKSCSKDEAPLEGPSFLSLFSSALLRFSSGRRTAGS